MGKHYGWREEEEQTVNSDRSSQGWEGRGLLRTLQAFAQSGKRCDRDLRVQGHRGMQPGRVSKASSRRVGRDGRARAGRRYLAVLCLGATQSTRSCQGPLEEASGQRTRVKSHLLARRLRIRDEKVR